MPEETPQPIENITAEWLYEDLILQEELCARVGISNEVLALCLQWDIIRPSHSGPHEPLRFPHPEVDRLCRGLRLHRDLGINWPGVSVALDLLDRLEELEHRHGPT